MGPRKRNKPPGPGLLWQHLPNLLTAIRIGGSPLLIVLAWQHQALALTITIVALLLSEWLDGYLARAWSVESAWGARLDTVADAVFYTSLLIALALLQPVAVGREYIWIAVAIGSYLLSCLLSLIKFRRIPSYHTWAAKCGWLVLAVGIACLLTGQSPWPLRLAMLWVTLTNLEAIAITWLLAESRVNVSTVWHLGFGEKPTDHT